MTLPASGSLSFQTLNEELRLTGGAGTLESTVYRWLSDQPSGDVKLPSEFYGKSAYKYLGVTGFSSLGTSHTFNSVDFGPFYTGRRIQIIVELRNKASAVTSGWNLTSVSIGGTSTFSSTPFWYQDGSGSTFFFGLAPIHVLDNMTATSGTVSFNSTQQTQCRIFVISIANVPSLTNDSGTAYAASTDPVAISGGVDTSANGVLLAASIGFNSGAALSGSTFNSGSSSGWTELYDESSPTFRTNISIKNRQSAGAKAVQCTWSGGTPQQAIVIAVARA